MSASSPAQLAAGASDAAQLRQMYRDMLRIRLVEEEIAERYGQEKMRCPVHLSIGQEAVSVGVSRVLRAEDQIVSTHRCHAHYLAKGGSLLAMLGELMGKEIGCCGGRGGSMHLFDPAAGVLLSLPIVAASIPVGVGAALAMQQRGKSDVAVIYIGDASLEEGVYHESANFAALHALPAIFVCENNLYSVYTPLRERQPARPLLDLGRAHGMPADAVDGNDVEAVVRVASAAVERARKGGGPSFIQADTYRWREHCGPNFDNHLGYRTEAEYQEWRARDPLVRLQRKLAATARLSAADEQRMRQELGAEIAAAFKAAEDAPSPSAESIAARVYAD
jgi:TPP-dependent pyruvate/acetoin dehydrogenase alpha subunit